MKKIYLFSFVSVLMLMLTFGAAIQSFAQDPALKVRVQPSGPDIPSSYVLSGESRTYFGNVEGSGTYEYMWEFSDGGSTAWADVTDARYISIDHTFVNSGLNWARLTVRDADNEDSVIIEVQTLSVDTTNRQKNSAVDRGLRKLYLLEQTGADGSYWGNSYQVAETSMALIAFENHRHNLEASDDDIYKKSVQEGLRWLFNHAYEVALSVQPCIDDPEGVPGNPDYDDLDDDNDGLGITFSMYGSEQGWTEGYEVPLAVLAIVNSCEKAIARTLTASSTSSSFVNGMTYWDIIVDAKDFLAYAQTDSGPGGGEGQWDDCFSEHGDFHYSMNEEMGGGCENVEFYVNYYNVTDCGTALFRIDYGDGITEEGMNWCDVSSAQFSTNHAYDPNMGPYIATAYFSQDSGLNWTEICSLEIECTTSTEECGINGWRYTRNDSSIDNSVSQWPALALDEAKDRWDINVNPQVIVEFDGWLAYSQNANGGFGYTSGDDGDWLNFAKTGAGLAMLKCTGYTSSDTNVQNALSFLDSNWDFTCNEGNLGDFYAMYAFYKGMKCLGLDELNGRIWEDIYTEYLVVIPGQNTDGSWSECGSWIPDPDMTTGMALAMLAPAVAGLPPVADAGGPYGPVNAGQNVPLYGSGSFHQDPTKNLVFYEWDFDASDGLWWDTSPVPPLGEGDTGIKVFTSYPATGVEKIYTVTLRVTDDSTPVQRNNDTSTVTVTSGNVPPVAQTNGPWAGLPGVMIIFDGTSSYDPNDCTTPGDSSCFGDYIASYEWDLDGDGDFNEANGDDGTPVTPGDYSIVEKLYPEPISQAGTLRVTDSLGLFDFTSPQVNIVSIALVYATEYNTCFREKIGRFEFRLGIEVEFPNLGTGTAENVIVTLTQTPTNLTILNGTALLGDMEPGDVVLTGCDPDTMSADIELLLNRRIAPTGEWHWKAEFDFNGKHYIIDNLPPIAP